jgi:hypothetical protein
VRHKVRGFRAPFLLILQHHDIPATTRITAPVTLPLSGDVDILAPRINIEGIEHRIRLLDLGAIPCVMFTDIVISASDKADAIADALDILLHGYPVGRPH